MSLMENEVEVCIYEIKNTSAEQIVTKALSRKWQTEGVPDIVSERTCTKVVERSLSKENPSCNVCSAVMKGVKKRYPGPEDGTGLVLGPKRYIIPLRLQG